MLDKTDEANKKPNILNQEEDEEIIFYGDPAMVSLVQFNADMGHIALNIFETFTVFDLI